MVEVLSALGIQTVNEHEQLVVTHPHGQVEVINGPTVQWIIPGTKLERRSAIVLDRREYCVVESTECQETRIVKGPQVLFLRPFEFASGVLPALALKENQYVRFRDQRTGQERIEVGPSNAVFPSTHETAVDSTPQTETVLAAGETLEIVEAVTNSVRVVHGPTRVFLSSTESVVDRSLLEQAEEDALAEALRQSRATMQNATRPSQPKAVPAAEKNAVSCVSKHVTSKSLNDNAAADTQAAAASDRPARVRDAVQEKTSPRTAVHSFLSQLFGKKAKAAATSAADAKSEADGEEALKPPAEQLQQLGRTVRYRGQPGGLSFAEAHEELLRRLEEGQQLQPKYVGGRGDCLFCCFLHYDGRAVSPTAIRRMRGEIADAVQEVVREDAYMGVVFASNAGADSRNGEGVTVEQYIAGIRGRAWGDTVCITQFCRLRRIKCWLHTIMNEQRVEETDFSDSGEAAKPVLQIVHHPDPEDGEMFHYEALVPRQPAGKEAAGLTLRQWRQEVAAVAEAARQQVKYKTSVRS